MIRRFSTNLLFFSLPFLSKKDETCGYEADPPCYTKDSKGKEHAGRSTPLYMLLPGSLPFRQGVQQKRRHCRHSAPVAWKQAHHNEKEFFMSTILCTSILETRTAPDQSLIYEAVVHPVCLEARCALSYGIRIYDETRFAEQQDITLSKQQILEFLILLARNTAQPEELHDLTEDFVASL